MSNFKQCIEWTWSDGGITAKRPTGFQPIVLSLNLTPQQQALIKRYTQKSVSTIDMSATDLRMVFATSVDEIKFWTPQ